LKKKEVIKVKILRSGIESTGSDRRELARYVARKVGAKLMGVRGRTFVLFKPPEEKGGGEE
jgi:RNA-binding protein